jgi:hypothetical protein
MKIFIISYLYAAFFILAVLVDCLPFLSIINNISRLSKSSFQTITSAIIDDSKKQEILLANSFGIFKQSLKLAGLVILVMLCGLLFLCFVGIFNYLIALALLSFMDTVSGIALSVISFSSWFLLKKFNVKIRL